MPGQIALQPTPTPRTLAALWPQSYCMSLEWGQSCAQAWSRFISLHVASPLSRTVYSPWQKLNVYRCYTELTSSGQHHCPDLLGDVFHMELCLLCRSTCYVDLHMQIQPISSQILPPDAALLPQHWALHCASTAQWQAPYSWGSAGLPQHHGTHRLS